MALAHGKSPMTPEAAEKYLADFETINNNIRDMFAKQLAASEVHVLSYPFHCPLLSLSQEPWDQEHFEELIAKWVAACDQPFSVVDSAEFRELLQYTHHPTRKQLRIPHAQSVKARIERMEEEMTDGLRAVFAVRC
jgi:hypothetical protein